MNTIGPTASPVEQPAPHRKFSTWGLVCQVFPVAGLVGTSAVMVWAAQPWDSELVIGDLIGTALFLLWAILPFLALSALVGLTDRLARPLLWIQAVVGAALLVYTGGSLLGFIRSESSTSALIFIFLPMIQLSVVAVTGAAVLFINSVRTSRKQRTRLTGGLSS